MWKLSHVTQVIIIMDIQGGCRWHIHGNIITECHNAPIREMSQHRHLFMTFVWLNCYAYEIILEPSWFTAGTTGTTAVCFTWDYAWRTYRSCSRFKTKWCRQLKVLLNQCILQFCFTRCNVSLWVQFKVLIVSYNGIHNIGPSYLRTDTSLWSLFIHQIHPSPSDSAGVRHAMGPIH